MADDNLSASDLRRRYAQGGTAADSELTASQLRARYGIHSNRKDFSTGSASSQAGLGGIQIPAVLLAMVLLGFLWFWYGTASQLP
mmetsp:Transcript_6761/g.26147  ORF Transcript_6761/g.26147 Transcript_6761/m.26147 type:complete len:85 (-) Transcript_6761:469-723(-)